MRKILQLTALSLAAAVALSLPAMAGEHEEHHGGPPGGHPGAPGGGHPGFHPGGPGGPGGFHGGPGGGHPGPGGHMHAIGERGYSFRVGGGARRDIRLFNPREREIWVGGHWHHDVRFGRLGYWYEVNGAWYFYDQPFEGPPAYVSEVEFFDPDLGPPAPVVVAPAPVVIAPAPVVVVPPPVVCVGPLCVR